MTEPAPLPVLWEYLKGMGVVPFGIPIMQRSWQVLTIFSLIDQLHVQTFIELGVWLGGMSDLLIRRQEVVGDIFYHGFDLVDNIDPRLKGHPSLTLGDVFSAPVVATVSNLIRARSIPALVYCDDGDKPREMRTYVPILRVGDYMMSHDVPGGNSVADLAAFGVEFPYMVEIDAPLYRGLELSLWRRNA